MNSTRINTYLNENILKALVMHTVIPAQKRLTQEAPG